MRDGLRRRNYRIWRERRRGATWGHLGRVFCLTRSRLQQIDREVATEVEAVHLRHIGQIVRPAAS